MALAINIEKGELLDLCLWKSPDEANEARVNEELADDLKYSFLTNLNPTTKYLKI